MKKILAAFVVLTLLCFTHAYAEPLDVASMTLDELVELRRQVTAEINERLAGSDGVFYPFDYVVGKQIPAGRYLVTCVEILNGESYGTVAVWAEGQSNWNCHIIEYMRNSGRIVFIELVEGDTLRIADCTVTIQPYALPTF